MYRAPTGYRRARDWRNGFVRGASAGMVEFYAQACARYEEIRGCERFSGELLEG